MPTKTRNYLNSLSPRPQVRWQNVYADGHSQWFSSSQYSTISRRSGVYETINSTSGIDGRFRPCTHEKHVYYASPLSVLPPTYKYVIDDVPPGHPSAGSIVNYELCHNLPYDHHAYYYSAFTSAVGSMTASLATVQWDALGQQALTNMLPSFHSQNSLVNFILELKDFKSVVKYMSGGISKKISLMEVLLGYRKKNKPLAKLSKMYLSYSFGWGPLYRDVASLVETIIGFKAKYDELMRRSGTPQQSYYGTWVSGTATNASTTTLNGAGGDGATGGGTGPGTFRIRCQLQYGASKGIRYHATVRYRYAMPPGLTSVVGKLKAFLDLLGISRNPAVLWNAIPFSFVVDWIVNVNRYLDGLRVDNIDFKTEILDFCHSAKIERTVSFALAGQEKLTKYGSVTFQPNSTTDTCVKTVYQRRLGLPNYLLAMQTSGLNPREFSLATALAAANGKRASPRVPVLPTRLNPNALP